MFLACLRQNNENLVRLRNFLIADSNSRTKHLLNSCKRIHATFLIHYFVGEWVLNSYSQLLVMATKEVLISSLCVYLLGMNHILFLIKKKYLPELCIHFHQLRIQQFSQFPEHLCNRNCLVLCRFHHLIPFGRQLYRSRHCCHIRIDKVVVGTEITYNS